MHSFHKPSPITCIAACIAAAFSLTGCGGSSPDKTTTQSPTRLVNGIVGISSPLGIKISKPDALKRDDLPFGAVTPYRDIDTGDPKFTVSTAGAADDATPLLDAASVKIDSAFTRTVVATGIAGVAADDEAAPRLVVLKDQTPPAALKDGVVAVRLVNLASGLAAPVDLYNKTTPVPGATNVTPSNPSGYALVPVTEDLALSVHDTRTGQDLALPRLAKGSLLVGNRAYTIVIIGRTNPTEGQEGLEAALLTDN